MLVCSSISSNNSIHDIRFDELSLSAGNAKLICFANQRNINLDKKQELLLELSLKPNHPSANKLFAGGYFIIIMSDESVTIMRDCSGQKSGYYYMGALQNHILISTNSHQIAKDVNTDMSELYTDFLLYQSYVPDGYTIYDNIFEVRCGEIITFTKTKSKFEVTRTISPLPIEYHENNYSESENIKILRDKIIDCHKELISNDNHIYLSGGIDSCAILAALHNLCPDKINNISFRVKGSSQDESIYAKKIARHLGHKLDVIEVDPHKNSLFANFEQEVMATNNPNIGNWIYRPKSGYDRDITYFAGQDTRLHTPSVNGVDMSVIHNISQGRSPLNERVIKSYEKLAYLFKFYNSSCNYLKYSHLWVNKFNSKLFIQKRKFQLDLLKYKTWGYQMRNFDAISSYYQIEFNQGMTEREIFNRVVAKKWPEQYINDIRYMTDMGRINHTKIVLPFYQDNLNMFASTIPWEMANKTMVGLDGFSNKRIAVNKFILRKAFEQELPPEIMLRAKAVSKTSTPLMMNGVLGNKMLDVVDMDIKSNESFCRRFGHVDNAQKMIKKRNRWGDGDLYHILYLNYLSALCLYYRDNIIK